MSLEQNPVTGIDANWKIRAIDEVTPIELLDVDSQLRTPVIYDPADSFYSQRLMPSEDKVFFAVGEGSYQKEVEDPKEHDILLEDGEEATLQIIPSESDSFRVEYGNPDPAQTSTYTTCAAIHDKVVEVIEPVNDISIKQIGFIREVSGIGRLYLRQRSFGTVQNGGSTQLETLDTHEWLMNVLKTLGVYEDVFSNIRGRGFLKTDYLMTDRGETHETLGKQKLNSILSTLCNGRIWQGVGNPYPLQDESPSNDYGRMYWVGKYNGRIEK